MSLEKPHGALKRHAKSNGTYRFHRIAMAGGNKCPGNALPSKMAVRAPFQRDFPALPVDELGRGASRDHRSDGTHRHAGALARLARTPRRDPPLSCTGSRNRRRRRSTSPVRQCRGTPDPSPHRTAGSRPDRSRRIHQTRRRALSDHRQGRRTHPSPRWHVRERSPPWPRAAAEHDSARPASRAQPYRSAAAWIFPPLRTASPSAASPIVPVTITRSPAFAPLR